MFIKEQQIVGRTIQKLVILDNKTCIKFTDGTYTGINYCRENYDDCYSLTWEDFDGFELKTLGIISEEEYVELERIKREQILKQTKEGRRYQYEALKKEFENG